MSSKTRGIAVLALYFAAYWHASVLEKGPGRAVAEGGEAAGGMPIAAGDEFAPAASKENQRFPAVACGGGVFLVAWQDGWNGVGGDSNILAVRIKAPPGNGGGTAVGNVLDAGPIRVCASSGVQEAPRIAFSGGVFLVVWHDFRNGRDADVYGARLTPDGKLLDPDGIPIAVRPHNQNFPLVCGDGKDFLVVWREVRSGRTYDLVAARVAADSGKALDPDGIPLARDAAAPALAFSGRHYFVAWMNADIRRKIGFCRYEPKDLSRVENEPVAVGHPDAFGHIGQTAMASGDGEVALLWARGIAPDPWGWGGPGAIIGVRISGDGQVPENKAFNKIRWSPEGREQYVKRLLPGVLDTARWKGFDGWPQGRPGGFKEAEGGLWPHAYLAATPLAGAKGRYFAVWVRAHMQGLGQTGRFDIVGGRLKSGETWEAPDWPPAEIVADGGAATLPAVASGAPDGPVLVVFERHLPDGSAAVKAKFVRVRPDP
ncbi:MAG: hypothetical protein N3A38_04305 [Planctomycetota bacterium]|nr:hypothetical protein [Planctomycetota bacterium]